MAPSLLHTCMYLLISLKLINGFQNVPCLRTSHSTEAILFAITQQQQSATSSKDELLNLLSSVPNNAPTPRSLTAQILGVVRQLELECPTPDDDVLAELAGNWELIWTAQDKSTVESQRGTLSWINPLENQSYSNFGSRESGSASAGRANPILPQEIQDRLEQLGILEPSGGQNGSDGAPDNPSAAAASAPIRSSQAIDRKRQRVRNVVAINIRRPLPAKGSLIVDVAFQPNALDRRRIDVKFDSCRLQVTNSPFLIDATFPLGLIGPTGWLRTSFIDEDMRITRGHKGSVFILSRTSASKRKDQEKDTAL